MVWESRGHVTDNMAAAWKPKSRDYLFERKKLNKPLVKTDVHPLISGGIRPIPKHSTKPDPKKPPTVKGKDPLAQLDGGDPLSLLTSSNDPLSVLAIGASDNLSHNKSPSNTEKAKTDVEEPHSDAASWNSVKNGILIKYTTSEKLSITTSFLSAGANDSTRTVKQVATVTDKVRNRLEQLDDFEDGSVKEMLNLSQQDYVKRIDDLNTALKTAWDNDQRVKALKIAIQCSKVLADVSVMQFYPSKFVLVTEILDNFGRLVYERILEKSTYTPSGSSRPIKLTANFLPEQVPETAKETCRNWFYKISSIRELLPRFYVEAAVLRCYKFFKPSEMVGALSRLAAMCRGIGNPLVSSYARCFLCRVGTEIASSKRDYIKQCFDDLILNYHQIQSDYWMDIVKAQSVGLPIYLSLYSPAVDWILLCLSTGSNEDLLTNVLEQCQTKANSSLLLNGILKSFSAPYIAKMTTKLLQIIQGCGDSGFSKHNLYVSLGQSLSECDPPEQDKLKVLNEVWKLITKLKEPSEYINCAEVWMTYVMRNFGKRELSTVLTDINKHMSPDRAFEDFYPNLLSILRKILEQVHNFSQLFSMERFLSFVDMFQKDTVKIQAAKILVEAFNKYQLEAVNDPVIVSTIMLLCKTLHDSVNALSLDDERRSVSQIICTFIHKVDYGTNFEQQLNFYVDSRANFTNLDCVITDLVQCVNNLAVTTRRIVKGNHSKKTSAFVRACAAYCFITIPSLESVSTQLNLYLLSSQIALFNRCLSQADALLKAAIAALLEMPLTTVVDGKTRSTEPFLIQYINNLLSTLVIVPDNPDQGVLLLYKGLVNVIKTLKCDNVQLKAQLYLSVLSSLSAISQEKFPYHVDQVESNDTLYGHDGKYLAEIEKVCVTVMDEILSCLNELSDGFDNVKFQSQLALTTFEYIICYGDIQSEVVLQLATKLWSLAHKYSTSSTKQTTTILELIKSRSHQNAALTKLLGKIA